MESKSLKIGRKTRKGENKMKVGIKLIPWAPDEQECMDRFFTTGITEMTLYKKLHKINPHRTYEAMMRRLRQMRTDGWSRDKENALAKLKIGYLDIEATNLNANFGYMLSWYIKEEGKNLYDFAVIKKAEIFNYEFDKRLVKELLVALKKYDVLYTHYGSDRRFDVPFIRTRAYAHGLQDGLPNYMEKFIMDTYPIAKNKLKLHSNRLGAIAEAVGVTDVKKTALSSKQWFLAMAGHPGALKYIVDHNKKDVQLLERVHKKLRIVERPIYRSI